MTDEPLEVQGEAAGEKSSGGRGGLGLLLGVFVGGVIFDSVTFSILLGMMGLIIGSRAKGGRAEETKDSSG